MNWTGGRLQRHSGPADTALARQKQHFARVKANLLSGKKGTPKKGPLFDGGHEQIHRTGPLWSAARLAEIERFQKSDGKEAEDKQRVKDIQRSSNERRRANVKKALHSIRDNGEQHNDHHDQNDHSHHTPKTSSKSVQNLSTHDLHPSSYFGNPPKRVSSAQIKKESAPDDLYDASPPPYSKEREREGSEPFSNPESQTWSEIEQSISSKKRKLMLKTDWVGVGFQKPPRVTFVPPTNPDKVAKRRKITDGHQARYGTRQAVIASPFVTKRRQVLVEQLDSQPSPHRLPSKNDVRISIGGRAVPPGISSSSVHSRKHSNQHTILSDRPHTRSSDVMLLDMEPEVDCGVVSHRSLATEKMKYYDDDGSYIMYRHPGMPDHHHPDRYTSSRTASRSIGSRRSGSRDTTGLEKNKYIHDLAQKRNIASMSRRHTESVPRSHEAHSSRDSRRIRSEEINLGRPESRPSTPFYCSSVSLHHPKPQSSRVSSILRSESTDIVESTIAQVGREKPVVPSSQILDNEIWESWLAPLQPQYSEGDEKEDISRRVSISPGISAAPTYKPPVEDISSNAAFETSKWESPEPYEGDSDISGPQAVPSPSEEDILPKPSPLAETNMEDDKSANVPELSWAFPESPSPLLAPIKALAEGSKPPVVSKQKKEEDHDDVWKKFVFGAGDEIEMDPKPTPAVPAGGDRFGSLMRAHLAVVNSTHPRVFTSPRQPSELTTPTQPSKPSVTSRRANRSPSHSKNKRGPTHNTNESTESSSAVDTVDTVDSARASGGSLHSWGSNSALATVAATAAPQSSLRTGSEGDTPGFRMQKRVTFSKPKPFVGSKAKPGSSSAVEEPVEFWRGLMGVGHREFLKKDRERKRHIINLIESDEGKVEVESIEDD